MTSTSGIATLLSRGKALNRATLKQGLNPNRRKEIRTWISDATTQITAFNESATAAPEDYDHHARLAGQITSLQARLGIEPKEIEVRRPEPGQSPVKTPNPQLPAQRPPAPKGPERPVRPAARASDPGAGKFFSRHLAGNPYMGYKLSHLLIRCLNVRRSLESYSPTKDELRDLESLGAWLNCLLRDSNLSFQFPSLNQEDKRNAIIEIRKTVRLLRNHTILPFEELAPFCRSIKEKLPFSLREGYLDSPIQLWLLEDLKYLKNFLSELLADEKILANLYEDYWKQKGDSAKFALQSEYAFLSNFLERINYLFEHLLPRSALEYKHNHHRYEGFSVSLLAAECFRLSERFEIDYLSLPEKKELGKIRQLIIWVQHLSRDDNLEKEFPHAKTHEYEFARDQFERCSKHLRNFFRNRGLK